jgi:SPP1 gp7 family putative phage head morphogenesis protein
MDFAHTETDKRIEELEKRLQAEYRQAYKETKGKLEKYLSDFARKDEAKRKLVEKGELSQADYKKWRTNQMLTGKRWTKMVDTLARDMNRTNQIAADIISGDLKGTFALNANFAAYGIENGFQTDFGFALYNEDTVNRLIEGNPDLLPAPRVDIPEDIRWNKQKITSNITQAVLQGKSIPEIAKTMQTVVGMNKASATTNARTAMTSAQNAGRQETYNKAKTMGIKLEKEWFATNDGKTRHSHAIADGQRVPLDGKFTVGRAKMRYPGDVQNGWTSGCRGKRGSNRRLSMNRSPYFRGDCESMNYMPSAGTHPDGWRRQRNQAILPLPERSL